MNEHCIHFTSNYLALGDQKVEYDGMDHWCCKCYEVVDADDPSDRCDGS